MDTFCVLVDRERGALVLRPRGEIDFHTAPALTGAVREAEGTWRDVVVDLSEVPFMDSAGVHALLDLLNRCRTRNGRLTVRGVSEQPARLLDLVGLSGTLIATG